MSKNFKALGITSISIGECNDTEQLLNWKLMVDFEITETTGRINTAKAKAASENIYSDPGWFAKIHGYKKVLGCLSQQIQFRIRELKHSKAQKVLDLPVYFMRAAKNILSPTMYEFVIGEAKDILKKENDFINVEQK